MKKKFLRSFGAFIALVLTAFASDVAFGLVRITNMNDFVFGSWSGVGDLVATDGVCIYDDASPSSYRLRFRGSGMANSFTISSGAATLPYLVEYSSSAAGFVSVTSNVTTTYSAAHATSQTCSGGTNGTIRITIQEANLSTAAPGNYSGTLTVRVQP